MQMYLTPISTHADIPDTLSPVSHAINQGAGAAIRAAGAALLESWYVEWAGAMGEGIGEAS